MTTAPNAAVRVPMMVRNASAWGAWTNNGLVLTMRKPPALMIPACMKAETGVGVSMVSGSQPWKGNCADFSAAHTASRMQAAGNPAVFPAAAVANSLPKSQVPW